MNQKNYKFHNGTSGAAISIRVTPRSSRNEVYDILDDGVVKIRLTAPPVDNQANQALIKFLSEILDVPASSLEIVAGTTGKDKLVTVLNMEAGAVQKRILQHLSKSE
jgi:uncharacterized protein (TIGR00251 family)